jgi:hypothetical protein
VHIKSKKEHLPEASEEEKDILSTLDEYYEGYISFVLGDLKG